tara:strand:- start:5354 stop:5764 length:411 start_codon:yes stop_codon:yes gene_type:complete
MGSNMADIKKESFTKYEKTRVLGARALQIAMDAPLLKNIPEKELVEVNFDPMEIASIELSGNVLPITVKQPMPKKKNVKIKKAEEKEVKKDEEIIEKEIAEEKEIVEEGEIMELANPQDEETEADLEGKGTSEESQ